MRSILLVPLLLACPVSAWAIQDDDPASETPVDTSRAPLLTHHKLSQALARLASEHAGNVDLLTLARKSRAGRSIDALRIWSGGERPTGQPAILLLANIDGPLVYTSGIALEHARRLAEGYGSDEAVTRLLDSTTVYIIARANPDAAEARFVNPLAEARATGHGVDNDRDGRLGEDGPSDVNGDGFVSVMRVPDPEGTWMPDPTDPRVLVEADPAKGERGLWKLVPEGRDSDGDEEVSEDPPLDAIVNRNFAQDWQEHDASAGLFPSDEPEVRALYEFVLAHEDIQLVLVYGELGNLVERGKGVADDAKSNKRIPPSGVRDSDGAILDTIGERYREITGDTTKGSQDEAGTFQAWCYAQRGIMTLNAALWSIPLDAKADSAEADSAEADTGEAETGAPEESEDTESPASEEEEEEDEKKKDEPSDDAKRMIWIDLNSEDARHLGWTAFDHPELGPVEVGGFAPYALVEPPDEDRVRIADKQFEFLLSLDTTLARVELRDVRATARGELLEVEAVLVNEGLLPLITTWGRRTRTTLPARVEIHLPQGATLLAGSKRILVSDLRGSGGRHELRWLVSGATPRSIGIRVETRHAGMAEVEVK